MKMAKKAKPQETTRVSTGDISRSAVAVGKGAHASNTGDSNNSGRELGEAKAELTRLVQLLEERELGIDQKDDVKDDVLAVRSELDKKKPNLRLIRPALKGIVASLGPAQALATLAAQVLTIVRRLG